MTDHIVTQATNSAKLKLISSMKDTIEGIILIVGFFFCLIISIPASADAVDDAFDLCNFTKSTEAIECKVSGGDSQVDVRLDVSGAEARRYCTAVSSIMIQRGHSFKGANGVWQLRIFSPYSGDHAIAICDLK
jgi:hypothetical protein